MWRCKALICVLFLLSNVLYFLLSAVNGAGEAQGIVGRTPPQSAARTKSRPAKTPTQTGEPVHTHYIPFLLFFSLLFFVLFLSCGHIYSLFSPSACTLLHIAHLSSQNDPLRSSFCCSEEHRAVTSTCDSNLTFFCSFLLLNS